MNTGIQPHEILRVLDKNEDTYVSTPFTPQRQQNSILKVYRVPYDNTPDLLADVSTGAIAMWATVTAFGEDKKWNLLSNDSMMFSSPYIMYDKTNDCYCMLVPYAENTLSGYSYFLQDPTTAGEEWNFEFDYVEQQVAPSTLAQIVRAI